MIEEIKIPAAFEKSPLIESEQAVTDKNRWRRVVFDNPTHSAYN